VITTGPDNRNHAMLSARAEMEILFYLAGLTLDMKPVLTLARSRLAFNSRHLTRTF
jgi:hypothetical protein